MSVGWSAHHFHTEMSPGWIAMKVYTDGNGQRMTHENFGDISCWGCPKAGFDRGLLSVLLACVRCAAGQYFSTSLSSLLFSSNYKLDKSNSHQILLD